jgi:hypothetical protein
MRFKWKKLTNMKVNGNIWDYHFSWPLLHSQVLVTSGARQTWWPGSLHIYTDWHVTPCFLAGRWQSSDSSQRWITLRYILPHVKTLTQQICKGTNLSLRWKQVNSIPWWALMFLSVLLKCEWQIQEACDNEFTHMYIRNVWLRILILWHQW